ncbi:MAG: DUF1569 domain-containing protein [Chitinophagaceae bacterium]|nr:DUF1569 domain-containing protein [Chitinophagaceae bacterium]
MIKNIFDLSVVNEIIDRTNRLTTDTKPLWGKMSVSQMLAHCNVTYEMVYDNNHPKPNAFMKFILKLLVKNKVVGEKPYGHNLRTAPSFLIKDEKEFEKEKSTLIAYIRKTQQLGAAHFNGKESYSFGKLAQQEWTNMFYKHLDHHLNQFGV